MREHDPLPGPGGVRRRATALLPAFGGSYWPIVAYTVLCRGIAGVCAAALPENAPHLAARCRARGLAAQGAVR